MYESPSWSPLTMTLSLNNTGELQKPWTLENAPGRTSHFWLPAKSYAATTISALSRNETYTSLPSVAGVLEANPFSRCLPSSGVVMTTRCHRIAPDLRSRHTTVRSSLSSMAVSRKIRSPHTIGDEWPRPGISVFQTTLLVALQWTGTFDSTLDPSPRGPRQHGQFSA